MASCRPCAHLEAIDVARAQPRHSGRVSLTGHGEGVGFVFCLGTTITHHFVPDFMPHFPLRSTWCLGTPCPTPLQRPCRVGVVGAENPRSPAEAPDSPGHSSAAGSQGCSRWSAQAVARTL